PGDGGGGLQRGAQAGAAMAARGSLHTGGNLGGHDPNHGDAALRAQPAVSRRRVRDAPEAGGDAAVEAPGGRPARQRQPRVLQRELNRDRACTFIRSPCWAARVSWAATSSTDWRGTATG